MLMLMLARRVNEARLAFQRRVIGAQRRGAARLSLFSLLSLPRARCS